MTTPHPRRNICSRCHCRYPAGVERCPECRQVAWLSDIEVMAGRWKWRASQQIAAPERPLNDYEFWEGV